MNLTHEKIQRIISELDAGLTIDQVHKKTNVPKSFISEIRFTFDMERAKNRPEQLYYPEELEGEELRILLDKTGLYDQNKHLYKPK